MRTTIAALILALAVGVLPRAVLAQQPTVEYLPLAERPIRKIALLGVAPSRRFTVKNDSTASVILGFGLIPALIEANEVDKKTRTYLGEMKDRKVSFAPWMIAALRRELSPYYEFVYLRDQRARLLEDKKTVDYSGVKTDADAILNVYYGHLGYLSNAFTSSYQPWVEVGVRLVDVRTQATLYFKKISVYQAGKDAGDIVVALRNANASLEGIRPDPRYSYATFEDLMARFDESVEGILKSQELIAQRIALNLSAGATRRAPASADKAGEPVVGAGQPFPDSEPPE